MIVGTSAARTEAPRIRGVGLTARVGGRTLFEGFDFELAPGELVVLTGPNGSGKSTLLRLLLRLAVPTRGRIEYGDEVRIGYVPQLDPGDEGLPFPAATIVAHGLRRFSKRARPAGETRRSAVRTALTQVGFRPPPSRRYTRLSGGERRRVLLARALVGSPNVLALDEPTAGVDADGEQEVLDLVVAIHRDEGTSVVWVAHGIPRLEARADRVVRLGGAT